MSLSNVRCHAICIALVMSFAQAAFAADILIADAKSQPESLTVAPGGVLIVGSGQGVIARKCPASAAGPTFGHTALKSGQISL